MRPRPVPVKQIGPKAPVFSGNRAFLGLLSNTCRPDCRQAAAKLPKYFGIVSKAAQGPVWLVRRR
jgi:hypothetical protein